MPSPSYKTITYQDQRFQLPANALGGERNAPKLKPADELLLDWAYETAGTTELEDIGIYHDRAGVLCTCVRAQKKRFVSNSSGHYSSLKSSYHKNGLGPVPDLVSPLEVMPSGIRINILQVPKSLELFELYLRHLAANAGPETHLACVFQTRYFTPKLVEIAGKYATEVKQSRAYKKARLLLLSDFLPVAATAVPLTEVSYGDISYQQYPGVFSANHIDYATQFMLDEWATNERLTEIDAPLEILDVGCGNGIIGDYLLGRYPKARLTATDISQVAVASTRLNLANHGYQDRAKVMIAASISEIEQPKRFDLIVTNPPFHNEYQTDISVSLDLFLQASERLSASGYLVVVANRHLNYLTHLRRYFDEVITVAENDKFTVYRSR
ncbi:class I SAM-dependent methyltransferase [Neolewinella persica]|uniref:class I SAM-dependent methyltransferase n=1 Tax=Neolewinella persica TaxID=70998 RepID=UPI000375A116|nr:methyltransferase [Neolewinella persica]